MATASPPPAYVRSSTPRCDPRFAARSRAQLPDGPVRRVALGEVRGRGVVHRPFGQRRRQQQVALGHPMGDALTRKSFDRGATDGFHRKDPIFDPV